MQARNDTYRDFLRRTDTLAVVLGLDIGDLPERLGISRASLFRYRSGKVPISAKAFIKLAFAETEAGIATPLEEFLDKNFPSEGIAAFIQKMMDDGSWNENLDGQLKAFPGLRVLARSVLENWGALEIPLRTLLDNIQDPDLADKVTAVRSHVRSFGLKLETFVETAAKIEGGGS
jgi:transcriptional regulator with XRE-family HTH domain